MGKITGFMEYARELPGRRPVAERVNDWFEIYQDFPVEKIQQQGARCMDCGIPFCHTGCPLTNIIPDWNDLVYQGRWQEAVRVLGVAATVHSGRAEVLRNVFDCITMRAVDKMERAVQAAELLLRPGCWLALMTTSKELDALKAAAGAEFAWAPLILLPGGEDRLLALGERKISLPV